MPNLDRAASQLGISEKTLRRWMRVMDPPIEPTSSRLDGRYKFITDEQVELIRQERANLREILSPPDKRLSAPVRSLEPNLTGQGGGADRLPIPTPPERAFSPRPRPPRIAMPKARGEKNDLPPMPAGHVSRQHVGPDHGIKASTGIAWCRDEDIETLPGEYAGAVPGAFRVTDPVTPRGVQQFCQIATTRQPDKFHTCEDLSCPCHELEASTE